MAMPSNGSSAMARGRLPAARPIRPRPGRFRTRPAPAAVGHRASGPPTRAFAARRQPRRRVRCIGADQVVQDHGDVTAERLLDGDRALRGEAHDRSIEVRGERHPVVVHGSQVAEAEDLVAAGVGQDRSVPGHEGVETAQPRNPLLARPERRGGRCWPAGWSFPPSRRSRGRDRLDRRLGADRHELGRVDGPVRGLEPPQPGTTDARGRSTEA